MNQRAVLHFFRHSTEGDLSMFNFHSSLATLGILLGIFTSNALAAAATETSVALICNSEETVSNLRTVPQFSFVVLAKADEAVSAVLVEPNSNYGSYRTVFSIGKYRLHSEIFFDLVNDSGSEITSGKLTIPQRKHLGVQPGTLVLNKGEESERAVNLGCIQL
jgi:hypothetical protein